MHQQVIMKHFWKRWVKEHTPLLTERRKWHRQVPNLRVNDILLIADDNSHRGKWPTGRVIEVNSSDDGVVRSVRIKTSTSEYVRPVTKLCLLLTHKETGKTTTDEKTKA